MILAEGRFRLPIRSPSSPNSLLPDMAQEHEYSSYEEHCINLPTTVIPVPPVPLFADAATAYHLAYGAANFHTMGKVAVLIWIS